MLWKNKVSAEQKADMVGYYLPGWAFLAAVNLAKEVPAFKIRHEEESNLELVIEIIAFYMHVANRLAFRDLGSQQVSKFSHRLMVVVANGVTTALHHDLSSVDVISQLRDTYNRREVEYAAYRKFVPDGDEPMAGTLFWEFTKVLFYLFINSDNTFDLLQIRNTMVPEICGFLKKTNEVLGLA
jgi:hypothetical protein